MNFRQFSKDDWCQLLRDYKSNRAIARHLGVTHETVIRQLVKHGLYEKKVNLNARKLNYQSIAEHYQQTQNYVQTAQHFGVTKSTVAKACREFGLNPGKKGVAQRKNSYKLPMNEIIARYQAGETCREIAKDYGVDDEVIRRRLVRKGVQMRRVGARTPEKNSQWNGGKGYKEYHYGARKVARLALGRKLGRDEVVHHHNENALDNALDNLWIFPSHVAHLRYHGKLRSLRNQGLEVDASQLGKAFGGVPLLELISQNASSPDTDLPVPLQKQA